MERSEEEEKERRKRALSAHESLMFGNTNPTNADIVKHEEEVQTYNKKVVVKVNKYNDAYYEAQKKKQKENIGKIFVILGSVTISVVVLIFYTTMNRNPIIVAKEEKNKDKIKVKASASVDALAAAAKTGEKVSDYVEVVDDGGGSVENIAKAASSGAKGSAGLSGSKGFTNQSFIGTGQFSKVEGKSYKGAGAGDTSWGKKDGVYYDDPFLLTNTAEYFSKYLPLADILEGSESLDEDSLAEVVAASKRNYDPQTIQSKTEISLAKKTIAYKIEILEANSKGQKKLIDQKQQFLKNSEQFLKDTESQLEKEQFKYSRWLQIKNKLNEEGVDINIDFSASNMGANKSKLEFAEEWSQYRSILAKEQSTAQRRQLDESKTRLNEIVNKNISTHMLVMIKLADSINAVETERKSIKETFAYINSLKGATDKNAILEKLEEEREQIEARYSQLDSLLPVVEERSLLILKKLN